MGAIRAGSTGRPAARLRPYVGPANRTSARAGSAQTPSVVPSKDLVGPLVLHVSRPAGTRQVVSWTTATGRGIIDKRVWRRDGITFMSATLAVHSWRVWCPLIAVVGCASAQHPTPVGQGEETAVSVLTRMCRTYEAMDLYVDRETLVRHDGMRGATNIVTTRMRRPSRFYFETTSYFLPFTPPTRNAVWQIGGLVQLRDAYGKVQDERSVEDALDALGGVSGFSSWLVPMLLMSPQAFPCHSADAELLGRTMIDGQDSFRVRLLWHSKLVVNITVDAHDFAINTWSLAHVEQPDAPYMEATVAYDTRSDLRDLRDGAFTFVDGCHYTDGGAGESRGTTQSPPLGKSSKAGYTTAPGTEPVVPTTAPSLSSPPSAPARPPRAPGEEAK